MPLHDWSDERGWDSVHQLWVNSVHLWLQENLPAGYRAYLGSPPGLAVRRAEAGRPDVAVRSWQGPTPERADSAFVVAGLEPDFRGVATLSRDPQLAVFVARDGELVSAAEFVSPRNKDRPSAREHYANRYCGYIRDGVHLMLIDVLPRPAEFSFVDAVAGELGLPQPTGFPPHAASWNVGEPTGEGQFIDGWYRALAAGEPLPTLPLALAAARYVLIDLERTYGEACRRAYLD